MMVDEQCSFADSGSLSAYHKRIDRRRPTGHVGVPLPGQSRSGATLVFVLLVRRHRRVAYAVGCKRLSPCAPSEVFNQGNLRLFCYSQ